VSIIRLDRSGTPELRVETQIAALLRQARGGRILPFQCLRMSHRSWLHTASAEGR
jgi:hypothetical protein